MDKILNLDSVDLYNKLYGLETLNPLVSVIDLNKATSSVDLGRRRIINKPTHIHLETDTRPPMKSK